MTRQTKSIHMLSNFKLYILGAGPKTLPRASCETSDGNRRARNSRLKHNLMLVTSAAALAMTAAPSAFAQNNDVDAFDGTVNTNCAGQAPIGATPTDAAGNDTANNRDGNVVSGQASYT